MAKSNVHAKAEAILSVLATLSRCHLHHFGGMAGYYRCFCQKTSLRLMLRSLIT